jgi:hypothetical protein
MAKFSLASLALALVLGGGAAFAEGARTPNVAATPYAVLVAKMDQAYHMQFKVPAAPEKTAARGVPAKSAG